MIGRYELPTDTRSRVAKCVAHLGEFPDAGSPLGGEWSGYRYVLGPWHWLLIVYEHVETDLVTIVTVEDVRSGSAATAGRARRSDLHD